jgi:DNA-binding NtrC family response regulator
MQDLRATALRIAGGHAKVLITGESGVGKDLFARFLHAHSPRARKPFVAVNCGAVSETLLESELFGHVRGSFTGAYRDKVGKLELADSGTIFLDEVAEMSLRMQVMLLRFLENGEVQRVGADLGARRVDVRVIAATNQDLSVLIASGRFRADLLYRLKVAHLHVPPLRDRRDEIRVLVEHIVAATGKGLVFDDEALRCLEEYRWPGNVRELQNVVENLACTTLSPTIGIAQLPATLRASGSTRALPVRERRRQLADDLFDRLVDGSISFWGHVHPLFLRRDLTRHDVREILSRGLAATHGNYRALLKLLGMAPQDYKRFLNFLTTHDCGVDYRSYRAGTAPAPAHANLPFDLAAAPQPQGLPGPERSFFDRRM